MDAKNLAVLMQLKNAMEMVSPSPVPTPHVASEIPKSKTGWLEKTCRFCKAVKVWYKADWVNPPIMCDGCRNERKTRYKPGRGDTLYSETQVFRGGSPGGGKHK